MKFIFFIIKSTTSNTAVKLTNEIESFLFIYALLSKKAQIVSNVTWSSHSQQKNIGDEVHEYVVWKRIEQISNNGQKIFEK